MATSSERNKVMKLLDMKGYDLNIIEDPAPFTVEISKYQKYGELLKNLSPAGKDSFRDERYGMC
jgi:hypothetical protein